MTGKRNALGGARRAMTRAAAKGARATLIFAMILLEVVTFPAMAAMADAMPKSTIYDYYSQNSVPYYSKNATAGCSGGGSSDSSGTSGGGSGGSWLDPASPAGANVQKVVDALADMGFSGPQIAGFIGNLAQEVSDINPRSSDDGANGAGGGGIVQWSPTRLRSLPADQANGYNMWSIEYQVKLIVYELSGAYKSKLSAPSSGPSPNAGPMLSITDPREAAHGWDNFYEVGKNPGDKRGNNAVAFWNANAFSHDGTKLQDIKGDPSKLGTPSGGSGSSSTSSNGSCASSGAQAGKGAAGAILWAKNIASDANYGYALLDPPDHNSCFTNNQTSVSGGPCNFDCGTFVTAAYRIGAGMSNIIIADPIGGAAFISDFTKAGFTDVTSSVNTKNSDQLKPGDVIVYGTQHVEIYIGNGQDIAAHTDRGHPEVGDQNNNQPGNEEVGVGPYWPGDGGETVTNVLRPPSDN